MQAKRIQVNEGNDVASGFTTVSLQVPTEPREQVNFHNIWIGVTVEPVTAGANCQGTWVLYVEPNVGVGDFAFTDSVLNLETRNVDIIACGVFSASNESPFSMIPVQIKTSRNINPNGRLVLNSTITGITVDSASNRVMLCAHTTRK